MEERWAEFKHFWTAQTSSRHRQQQHKVFLPISFYQPSEDEQGRPTLAAVEFELRGESTRVCLERSQVCLDSTRKHKDVLIYLFNHLPSDSEAGLQSFVGVFGSAMEQGGEERVQLRPVSFTQSQYELAPWQHFTQFNYH